MWNELQAFFTQNWWVSVACAIIVLIVGWKMSAPWANWLLVAAWVILAFQCYRSLHGPGVNFSVHSSILLAMGFASLSGLAIFHTLWTKIEDAPLRLFATTSAAERPAGSSVGGILWQSKFGELKIAISNTTSIDYQNIDLVITPDVPATAAGQMTELPGVSIWRNEEPKVTPEIIDGGLRTAIPLVPIASDLGYRVRCVLLPTKSRLEVVLAVVTMYDRPSTDDVDKLLKIDFSDGRKFWMAHPNHTINIFGPTPIPRLVMVKGRYTAQQREYELSETLSVIDIVGAEFKR